MMALNRWAFEAAPCNRRIPWTKWRWQDDDDSGPTGSCEKVLLRLTSATAKLTTRMV